MARSIPSRHRTPADELRLLLDESEKRAVSVRNAGPDDTRELLEWLDRIHRLFPELEAGGVDLAPERGRWQAVQGKVRSNASNIRRELASLGGLSTLRSERVTTPAQELWWWWLDEAARESTRKRIRNTSVAVIVIIGLLIGGRWLMNRFFPVDPLVLEAYTQTSEAERQLEAGAYAAAISHYEAARAAMPDDANTLAWLAMLYEITEQPEQAAAITAELQAAVGDSLTSALLADSFTRIGQMERGLELAQAAIADDPDNAQAHLAEGGAYEALGRFGEAILSYERASILAETEGNHYLQAIARIRMGQLMQAGPGIAPQSSSNQ